MGWSTRHRLTTQTLPLEALNQAIATATGTLAHLVHHSDRGSQYVSIAYSDRLKDMGISASTGSVGDSYDNALAESVNGLYKTELIYSQSWHDLAEVEWVTLCWVRWWNTMRLHSQLNYHTPQEIEDHYWHTHTNNTYNNELVIA